MGWGEILRLVCRNGHQTSRYMKTAELSITLMSVGGDNRVHNLWSCWWRCPSRLLIKQSNEDAFVIINALRLALMRCLTLILPPLGPCETGIRAKSNAVRQTLEVQDSWTMGISTSHSTTQSSLLQRSMSWPWFREPSGIYVGKNTGEWTRSVLVTRA